MPRRLTDTERQLWSRVTRDVRRTLPRRLDDDSAPAAGKKAKPAPAARAVPKPAEPKRRKSMTPPADVSAQRRIRRGQAPVDAKLDLHGHTHDAARSEFARFLRREHAAGARCVLVITGKGRAGGGVLRARFPDWLADPELRAIVAGYARAHLRHGGDGAFYVLLKAKGG